jgi:hypothetical protein
LSQVIQPFDENDIPKENKFWKKEAWDMNLPHPGFVTDFVLATRGIITPTKFCAWTALFLISTVVYRDAELDWSPLKFYLNLFILVVAPPCFCGKSSTMNWALDNILKKFHERLPDGMLREWKKVRQLIQSKCTPEGLIKQLKSKTSPTARDHDGILKRKKLGSRGVIVVSELSTFLDKKQYNTGMVERLTDLYDCKLTDSSITATRDKEMLKDIYVTFFGATTPHGIETSIPEAAMGEGFLSRLIILSEDNPTRKYSKPQIITGGPTIEDLQLRLAWIAQNCAGVYTLAPEVEVKHNQIYKEFLNDYENGRLQPGRERDMIHLLKTAVLVRMQRYEIGNLVEMQDYNDALKLIKSVQDDAKEAATNITVDERTRKLNIVRKYLKRRGQIDKKTAQMQLSPRGILSSDLRACLNELNSNGEIEIKLDGKVQVYPSSNGKELYIWMGSKHG